MKLCVKEVEKQKKVEWREGGGGRREGRGGRGGTDGGRERVGVEGGKDWVRWGRACVRHN